MHRSLELFLKYNGKILRHFFEIFFENLTANFHVFNNLSQFRHFLNFFLDSTLRIVVIYLVRTAFQIRIKKIGN